MLEKTFNVKLQNARDLLSNWQTNNPILKSGELAIVFDVDDDPSHYKVKVGDGITPFNDLPYFEDQDKVSKETLGAANGVASLDENGKIPLWQLPEDIGGRPLYTVLERVPEQLGTLIYNGESQMPVWRFYDPDAFLISGTVSAKDAGEYQAIFQPAVGYVWADGSQTPVYCKWNIQKKVVAAVPSLSTTQFTFNGVLQTPHWLNYSAEELTIGGDLNGTSVGSYTTTFTPTGNYVWADGTSDTKEVVWEIKPRTATIPVQNGTLIYNGNSQTPAWTGYDTEAMTISGALTGTNADSYIVLFTLKAGYVWPDGSSNPVEVEWVIQPQEITSIPVVANTLTYNGAAQSPEWNDYSSVELTMGGDLSATDAGEYETTFTPNPNYVWSEEILAAYGS